MSLRWAHMPFCWFCHEAALIITTVLLFTDPEQVRGCMQAKQRKMFNLEKKYMDLLQAKHAHVCQHEVIDDQRRLRPVCASAQSRQSLRCSHI